MSSKHGKLLTVFLCGFITILACGYLIEDRFCVSSIGTLSRRNVSPTADASSKATTSPTVIRVSDEVQQYLDVPVVRDNARKRLPYNFTITPWKIRWDVPRSSEVNEKHIQSSMVAVIKSKAGHFAQRDTARSTWVGFEFIDGLRLEVIFIVGKVGGKLRDQILQESERHGDILQIEVDDTYSNLVHKTVAGMQFASQNFPNTWFYASGDDDIMPDLVRLKDQLFQMKRSTNFTVSAVKQSDCKFENIYPIMSGYGYNYNAMVMRATVSKWYISKDVYSHSSYPTYCSGGWYMMSIKLVEELYYLSQRSKYFWIDDVWITGILRLKYFSSLVKNCYLDDINVGLWRASRRVVYLTNNGRTAWSSLVAKIHGKSYVHV